MTLRTTREQDPIDRLSPAEYQWYMRMAMVNIEPRDPNYARFEQLHCRHLDWVADTTVERQAIHQAGHAIVAHALGWEMRAIDLPRCDGDVHVDVPSSVGLDLGQRMARLHQWVRQRLAGVVAEEIAWGMAREPETGILAQIIYRCYLLESDATTAGGRRALKRTLPGVGHRRSPVEEALSLMEQEAGRAQALLIERWTEVERLAAELLKLTEGAEEATTQIPWGVVRALVCR